MMNDMENWLEYSSMLAEEAAYDAWCEEICDQMEDLWASDYL